MIDVLFSKHDGRVRKDFKKMGSSRFMKTMMLKIILILLIAIEILLVPLMIFCLSGVNLLLPGLGLVISGGVVFVALLFLEAVLVLTSLILYRIIRRRSRTYP